MRDKHPDFDKELFTTYEIAKICNANIASIKNWIGKGYLKAFRTPGGHFRVKRRDLDLFLQKYNMPNPLGAKGKRRVYALDSDEEALSRVKRASAGCVFMGYTNPFEAAIAIGLEPPDILVFDPGPPDGGGLGLLAALQVHAETRNIQVVLFTSSLPTRDQVAIRRTWKVADIVSKSVSDAELEEAISRLL